MVMLAGSTGLRRSEMFALPGLTSTLQVMQVAATRGVVRNRIGRVKTPASRRPVPLHESVCAVLKEWRKESVYPGDTDFLFVSLGLKGEKPVMPDIWFGWRSFRHSLATNLRSMGMDVKIAQELLRHANSQVTMDIYTRAVSADKREASQRQIAPFDGRRDGSVRASCLCVASVLGCA